MLAQRLPGLLPELDEDEALETAAIRSLSLQGLRVDEWRRRPFRAPHHTASAIALVGGGGRPRPGEISLAHNGVLFLDELPEFDRRVLEVLREPLESGHIVLSRAARQAEFPARFQLVAAMNPCPCGHFGDTRGRCRCPQERIAAYRSRISGPLLDRIDLHVEVGRVALDDIAGEVKPESTAAVARACGSGARGAALAAGHDEREPRCRRTGPMVRAGRAERTRCWHVRCDSSGCRHAPTIACCAWHGRLQTLQAAPQ